MRPSTPQPVDVATPWTGWGRRRKGGRWFKLCQAPTLGEAALQLHRRGREQGILDRNQMLVHGDHPPREDGAAAPTEATP
jgi:hypothetical protein